MNKKSYQLKYKIISINLVSLLSDEWSAMLKNFKKTKPTQLLNRIDYIQTEPTKLLKRHRAVTQTLEQSYDNLIKLEQDIKSLDPSNYDEYVILEEIIMDLFNELVDSELMRPREFPFKGNNFEKNIWIFSNHFHISVLTLFEHYKLNYPIINTSRLKGIYERMLNKSLLTDAYLAPCFNSKINKLLSINYFYMPKSISKIIHLKINQILINMRGENYYQSMKQLADIRFLRHCLKSFYFLNNSSFTINLPKNLAKEWDIIFMDKRPTAKENMPINEYFIARQSNYIQLLKRIFT